MQVTRAIGRVVFNKLPIYQRLVFQTNMVESTFVVAEWYEDPWVCFFFFFTVIIFSLTEIVPASVFIFVFD